jgi:hypothetical protein
MKQVCTALVLSLALLGAARADDPSTAATSPALSAILSSFTAKHLVMLYRKETDTAPNRLDPTIQATSAALQHEFLDRHFKLSQATPAALAEMDRGPDVVVAFAPDAGMSMIYSVYSDVRPTGAPDMGIAEIRISAQVYIGSSFLSVEEGHGQLQTRTDQASAAYGVRKAYEVAAKDAASELADRIEERINALTPTDITEMVAGDTTTQTSFTIASPSAPAVAAGTPSPSAPPGAAPQTPPPDSGATAGNHWLLAVGVGDVSKVIGIQPGNNLAGPATDMKNIQTALRPMGFDATRTIALLDKAATTAAVTQALEHFRQVVQPNDEFVFYISGHGMQLTMSTLGKAMPILYDTNVRMNESQLLDFNKIAKLIGAIPGKAVMVIDTCHAGAASSSVDTVVIAGGGVRTTKTGGSPKLAVMMRGVKATGDMAILTASDAEEESADLGAGVGGLFTSELIKAIQTTHGAAALQVLYDSYVRPNVIDTCAKIHCAQTPQLAYDGGGNLIRIGGSDATRGVQAAPASNKAKIPTAKPARETT